MFRFSPATPLAQKTHPIAQPTCDEMHCVTRFFAGPAGGLGGLVLVVERGGVGVGVGLHRRGELALPAGDLGDEDGLDGGAVLHRDEELPGAIRGSPLVGDAERRADSALREGRPERPGQVGHLGRVGDAPSLDPAEDLLSVERSAAKRLRDGRPLLGQACERRALRGGATEGTGWEVTVPGTPRQTRRCRRGHARSPSPRPSSRPESPAAATAGSILRARRARGPRRGRSAW